MCYARRYSLIGSALSRISVALVVLLIIGTNYADRDYYWGPSGGYPLTSYFAEIKYSQWFVYGFHGGETYFELVFHLQIVVTVIYLIGYRNRVTAPIFYFMLFSLCERNDHLLNGGTNLVMTVSPFLALVDSSRRFSVDAILRRRRRRRPLTARYMSGAVCGTLFHNFAILLIVVQISLLYFTAGINKLQGPLWMRGEAIYYILASPVFGIRALDEFLSQHMAVTAFLTYSTIVFQVGFPVFIYWKCTRTPLLAVAVLFHLSIAVVMGLPDFSFIMISIELLIVDDDHYRGLVRTLNRSGSIIRAGFSRR